jgi:hypothetical protein
MMRSYLKPSFKERLIVLRIIVLEISPPIFDPFEVYLSILRNFIWFCCISKYIHTRLFEMIKHEALFFIIS